MFTIAWLAYLTKNKKNDIEIIFLTMIFDLVVVLIFASVISNLITKG